MLLYRYGDVPFKPYVKELYTPKGVNCPARCAVGPSAPSRSDVCGRCRWRELLGGNAGMRGSASCMMSLMVYGPTCRTMRPVPDSTGLSAGWPRRHRPDSLLETRKIVACQVGKLHATVVTWRSEFRASKRCDTGDAVRVALFRAGHEVRAVDGWRRILQCRWKEGTIFRGEERLVQSNWCAYTAAVDGKPVTVAMFGHPANPRPTTWFTMAKPFAYLSRRR